jgi:K+-transporting ATPase ATPase C chain
MLITGIAQVFFPYQANGSLILKNNQLIGSKLIGQQFSDPKYFIGRPSATTPFPYNATASSGSNLGPNNPVLLQTVEKYIARLKQDDPQNKLSIPVDLVTASGSGLDPEISPFSAYYQAKRIARLRHLSEEQVNMLIQKHTKLRTFWILGEPRVNVLQLNLALNEFEVSKNIR